MRLNGGRPGDERGFVHKSKFGKFVTGRVGDITGAIPGIGTAITTVRTGIAGVKALTGAREKEEGKRVKFLSLPAQRRRRGLPFGGGGRDEGGRAGPCDFPMVLDSQGRCRTPTSGEFGGEQFGVGAAVMGRYGAALEPGSMIIDRAVCLRGMQLGDDGLCYNKSQISNKQRMWPAGRKPLLSGGDMRAISIAARAGRRLDQTTKRLRRLGMMKALPAPRKPAAHAHAKPIAAVSV